MKKLIVKGITKEFGPVALSTEINVDTDFVPTEIELYEGEEGEELYVMSYRVVGHSNGTTPTP